MPPQATSVVETALDRPLLLIDMSLGELGMTMLLAKEWTAGSAGIAMTAVVAFLPLLPTLTVMFPDSRKSLPHRSP